MTRIVTFADGFESAVEPSIEGFNQENYVIANNATNHTLFTIDQLVYKSAFFDFEIIRKDVSDYWIETGNFQLIYINNQWQFAKGVSIGDEVITSSIDLPYNVAMSMVTASGVGTLRYSSGNMGSSYLGTFKVIISRTVA